MDSGGYFSSAERRWSVCLSRSVSGGVSVSVSVSVRASENATVIVSVRMSVAVRVRVSVRVMVRLSLRETAPPSRARENVSRKNQMGTTMLEVGRVQVARNG